MKYLFLRLLPWLVGALSLGSAEWVWRHPQDYPWPLLIAMLCALLAGCVLAWRRLSIEDFFNKMLPSALAMGSIAFAFLMPEQAWERGLISLAFAGVPLYALELLFLLTYQPTRYPVNGLSRLNMALVPLSIFCLATGVVGMQTHLRCSTADRFCWPNWATVATFVFAGAVFAVLTTHPSSDRNHRIRWSVFGALIGFHIAILCVILPVALSVMGCIAALAVAFPLRARRYTYEPKPPTNLAWAEGLTALFLFVVLVLTSRWA